jgi:hypothetical protein
MNKNNQQEPKLVLEQHQQHQKTTKLMRGWSEDWEASCQGKRSMIWGPPEVLLRFDPGIWGLMSLYLVSVQFLIIFDRVQDWFPNLSKEDLILLSLTSSLWGHQFSEDLKAVCSRRQPIGDQQQNGTQLPWEKLPQTCGRLPPSPPNPQFIRSYTCLFKQIEYRYWEFSG